MGYAGLQTHREQKKNAVVARGGGYLFHERLVLLLLHAGQMYTRDKGGRRVPGSNGLLRGEACLRGLGARFPRRKSQHVERKYEVEMGSRPIDIRIASHPYRDSDMPPRDGRGAAERTAIHAKDEEKGDRELRQSYRFD